MAGGAITGGASAGLVNPDDATTGAVIGGVLPPALKGLGAAGSVIGNVPKAAMSFIEPFYAKGQDRIIGRALNTATGGNADDVIRNINNYVDNVPGVNPTVAEAADNAGIAATQRAALANSPFATIELSARQIANNQALNNALDSIIPDRVSAVNARENAVNDLYAQAKGQNVIADDALNELMQRPAIKNAFGAAGINMQNQGKNLVKGETIAQPAFAGESHTLQNVPDSAYFNEMGGELIAGGEGKNILQQIKSMGGINQSHLLDITGENAANKARAQVGLFNKNGLGADDLASQLYDMGYIPQEEMAVDGGVQYMKDMVRESIGGNKQFALNDIPIKSRLDGEFINPTVGDAGSYFEQLPGDKVFSGDVLHEVKMALDAQKNLRPTTAADASRLRGVQSASTSFNDYLDNAIPEYAQAKNTYAEMSKPVNQSDVLTEILAKAQDNFGNITPNRGMGAISDKVAQRVLGRDNATLANTLAPEQLSQLEALQKVLTNMNFAQNAGKATGSNTVQNAAYANILNQFGVPNLLRNSSAGGVVGGLVQRAGDVAYKNANQQIAERMAMSLLEPQTAAQLMQGVRPVQSQSMQYLPSLVKTLPALMSNQNR